MNFLFLLLIFSIPLNLFLKISVTDSFVNGLQVDYLIQKIYLSDLLLALTLIAGAANLIRQHSLKKLLPLAAVQIKKIGSHHKILSLLILILAFIIRQLTTKRPAAAVFFALHLGAVYIFARLLTKQKKLLSTKFFNLTIIVTFLVQSFLGIYQFLTQKPLLAYHFLGEPRFEPYYRLSRHIFSGQEKILAYGSTAHPNILAAAIVLLFLIIASKIKPFKKIKQNQTKLWLISILFLLSLIIIYITQARAALATLILGCIFLERKKLNLKLTYNIKKIALTAVLFLVPAILAAMAWAYSYQPSIYRRHLLNIAAIDMFLDQPFLGQGLNHFTVHLEEFSRSTEVIKFIQPVHHLGLLLLAETGILGLLILIFSWRLLKKKSRIKIVTALLILSPLLISDHFLYSLQPGRLLLVLFIIGIDL